MAFPLPELPYFPRPELSETILRVLQSGLQQAVTLFAPRRQGKTTFLTHELIPAAENRYGWQVIDIDLWALRSDPARGLVEGLEAFAGGKPDPGARWRLSKVKGKLKPPGLELEGEFDAPPPATSASAIPLETRLLKALACIVDKAEVTLLVLDEFQALAAVKDEDFVAALRTGLQRHRGHLLAVFTGSSRAALDAMFRRQRAPLFQSAYPIDLPPLDEEFVVDRAEFLRDRSGLKVEIEPLAAAFERLGRTPEYMNFLITDLWVQGSGDIEQSMANWREKQRLELADGPLKSLKPLDLAIIELLAGDESVALYTQDSIERLSARMGRPVPTSSITRAVKRMEKIGLVTALPDRGRYEIEDPSLRVYVRESSRTP